MRTIFATVSIKRLFLPLAMVLIVACGPVPDVGTKDGGPVDGGSNACNASNCGGCCNGNRCETGAALLACGSNGAGCIACGASQACTSTGKCEAVAPADAGTQPKRIFITRNAYDGNLKTAGGGTDGLSGADKLCDVAAMSASLGGVWKAWLSTTSIRARDRILDVGPWVNLHGSVVFPNKASLLTGPMVPIEFNERNESTIGHVVVGGPPWTDGVPMWTGTNKLLGLATIKYTPQTPATCSDWSATTYDLKAEFGLSDSTTGGWTEFAEGWSPPGYDANTGLLQCNSTAHLICFEQ